MIQRLRSNDPLTPGLAHTDSYFYLLMPNARGSQVWPDVQRCCHPAAASLRCLGAQPHEHGEQLPPADAERHQGADRDPHAKRAQLPSVAAASLKEQLNLLLFTSPHHDVFMCGGHW